MYENTNLIENCYQYKKSNSADINQIAQAYIFTKNMTASIIRFFYFANSNKSYALKIDNY